MPLATRLMESLKTI